MTFVCRRGSKQNYVDNMRLSVKMQIMTIIVIAAAVAAVVAEVHFQLLDWHLTALARIVMTMAR